MQSKRHQERVIPGETEQSIYETHVELYVFASDYVKEKCVLDIACGSGYGSALLHDVGKARLVVGVDISSAAIEYASSHYQSEGLVYMRGDATNLEFNDESFDAVISFETIEHIREYESYLREVKRLLKEGGVFLVSTPNKRFDCKNPYHLITFSPDDFQGVLLSFFDEVKMYGRGHLNTFGRFFALSNRLAGYVLPSSLMNALWRSMARPVPLGDWDSISDAVELHDCRSLLAVCKKLPLCVGSNQQDAYREVGS